jgi:signal transduction histidine kinase
MAIAVHDLKNPLLNILSTARIIKKREYLSKEQAEEYTDIIINQTDRMFGLIKKLLDHNAIEQGKIKISNSIFVISELCSELVQIFGEVASAKEINLVFDDLIYVSVQLIVR